MVLRLNNNHLLAPHIHQWSYTQAGAFYSLPAQPHMMPLTDGTPGTDAAPRQPSASPRRKAVLFCPECGHENPIDGDWLTSPASTAAQPQRRCPQCATIIMPSISGTDINTPTTAERSGAPTLLTALGTICLRASMIPVQGWIDSTARSWRLLRHSVPATSQIC
jgi:phage terminase large subunit GpA-like protein